MLTVLNSLVLLPNALKVRSAFGRSPNIMQTSASSDLDLLHPHLTCVIY